MIALNSAMDTWQVNSALDTWQVNSALDTCQVNYNDMRKLAQILEN